MRNLILALAIVAFSLNAPGADRTAQWQAVEDAVSKGLPQTAITNLLPIIRDAMREKAYPEATKAIAQRIALEGNIQGNKPEEKITRLEAEITKAPKEIAPMLQTILANWYWHYFQQNRWRFVRRTATGEAPGKDFTTWDLPRLFAEIDKHFTAPLSASELRRVPVNGWDGLLERGSMPDTYRPTLYDFVAHEALAFYTSAEQVGAKPQDAFEISADDPALDTADKFLAWRINLPANDAQSPKLKALLLFQELLRFHQNDRDQTAFAAVDLERLTWAHNVAFGDNKSARYNAALEAFVAKWTDHELSAKALYEQARLAQSAQQLAKAHAIATRARNTFPNSIGGRRSANLISELEAKLSSIQTERIWNQPAPKLTVRYRNVSKVYFRAVAWDWADFLERRHRRPENLNEQERAAVVAKKPALEWSHDLRQPEPYAQGVQSFDAPKLPPGFYFILSSHEADFREANNVISCTDVWVSDLALVLRSRQERIEGFVLNALSGEPIRGARIDAWHLDQNGNRVARPAMQTDSNGFFTFNGETRGYLVRATANNQQVASAYEVHAYNHGEPQRDNTVVFFTDRALYRPGQTISYKGIALSFDHRSDDYRLLGGKSVVVVFNDPNGKEIARNTHTANDYGSLSGSFTAPRDRVMGAMSLQAMGAGHGYVQVRVEEYKRPKFEVKLEAPKTAAKLNDTVALTGKAESYTGAAIDGANVRWRVVREVRWPIWWGWCSWRWSMPRGESQEIAHGTARTETDGTFKVQFNAKPDTSISPTNEPTFVFTIHADVTDTTGETRSDSTSVRVGYTAMEAALTADDWQTADKPVALTLKTTTLDGQPQSAEGSLKIYRLQEPATVQRRPLSGDQYFGMHDDGERTPDLSDPNQWPLGEVVVERGFTTDASGEFKASFNLGVGAYRATVETQDRFGKNVTALLPIRVLDREATKLAIKVPSLVAAPKWSVEPGEEFTALWGSGYDTARAFIEIEHRHQMLERYWTKLGQTQQQIRRAIDEKLRGGFTVHITQVRENRAYLESRRVDVPWSNKELDVTLEHFTSKLEPTQKETWTAVIKPKRGARNAELGVAEMVATLYDASLDAYAPHHWSHRFGIFRNDHSFVQWRFENSMRPLQHIRGYWQNRSVGVDERYRSFPHAISQNLWRYDYFYARSVEARPMMKAARGAAMEMDAVGFANESLAAAPAAITPPPAVDANLADKQIEFRDGSSPQRSAPKLDQVTARKNLNETAFFFPQLISDSNGVVRMQFTMPEALTKWQFFGFAHDKQLRSGFMGGTTITAKDLMVQPNPPRFVREGDVLEFTAKVSNQSAARQSGSVRLTFALASSTESADKALGNANTEHSFDIPAKESRTFSWRIRVPDGLGFLTYKAVASTGRLSDGEEGVLPVLSRRVFVTESLPLPIRGPGTKKFEFAKLVKSGKSDTLQHQSLTVQMVSNPSWYAVLALPYLMEFPYECSEQTFNRFYANALARHIANSDPKIRRVFDQWRNTPALDSPLEKNQDLKAVMLEETPWYRQAKNESEARRNVGMLFDENRLNNETERTLRQLAEMQLGDGGWPWFPGGRADNYITLYIVTGFGRMRHLGVDVPTDSAVRALQRLDAWVDEQYREILRHGRKHENNLTPTIALYLYGRSFFLKDRPVAKPHTEAVNYFIDQAKKHWLALANRQSQGHLALALHRWGEKPAAQAIMRSIKERSVTDEELGRFWRDTELSWWWYRAPIETQALMIEAFDEVMGDAAAVEECKAWLLKQKQTQDWKTTKATADAVYALLLRGGDWLASEALVEVSVGGKVLRPSPSPQPSPSGRGSAAPRGSQGSDLVNGERAQTSPTAGNNSPSPRGGRGEGNRRAIPASGVEPGTGFYEARFAANEVKPKLGEIVVKKSDPGIAWGSVHWHYLADISKVTPHSGTPLKLAKGLFRKVNTARGPVLEPVKGALNVGDEVVVRIELRTDRDMEYVHMKDQRGSGTEPVNVLSRYKYQDGLAYYESTRDTATHFFIDYLPKGVYVFEYSVRVQHRGEYRSGVTSIQCMYAPEFNSHSGSVKMAVK